MKTIKVIGVLVLIFAAGFSGGIVATRVIVRQMVRDARQHPEATSSMIRTNVERNLIRTLRLSPEQQKQVHEILKDSRDRRRPIIEQYQPRLDAITIETRSNISAKLTPEQQQRFKEFLSENRQFLPLREPPPKRDQSSNTNLFR
jgi:Spy/CpxP family protein refolding chaperone